MTRVVSLRPGVTRNRSAFEAMTLIYQNLEKNYDYKFTIVHSTTESYKHPRLQTTSIPPKAWKPSVPHTPLFLRRFQYRKHIDPYIESADVVLTVDPTIFQQGALVIQRAHALNTPVFYDASKTIAEPDPHWYAIRPRIKKIIKKVTGIVTTVPKVFERYRDLGLFDATIADKFTIMGHPVNTEVFAPDNDTTDESSGDPIKILAVTRLVPEKGVFYIFEAIKPLLQSGVAELQFIGDGPMQSVLEREAKRRGLEATVEFLGTVSHAEVAEYLRSADIFVNHAVSINRWEEYFGVANLEAMACGLPTVITDCGSIPYVVQDSEVAEIIPQRDIDSLRETLNQLVGDPERRQRLGRDGRTYVEENYSVERIATKYHEMLHRDAGCD